MMIAERDTKLHRRIRGESLLLCTCMFLINGCNGNGKREMVQQLRDLDLWSEKGVRDTARKGVARTVTADVPKNGDHGVRNG